MATPEAVEIFTVDERVNLRHVPADIRPPRETPDPDDDPIRPWREEGR